MSLSPISRYRYDPHSHLYGFVQALVPGSSINAMVKRYLRCFRCYRQLADATTQLLVRSPPPPLVGNPPTDFLFVAKQSIPKESAPSPSRASSQQIILKICRRQYRWCFLRSRDGRGALYHNTIAHAVTSTPGRELTGPLQPQARTRAYL